MKLSCVLLLALVAMVVADSSEYYQSDYSQEYSQEPSNYYSSRRGRPASRGIFGKLKNLLGLGATRRQFTGPTGTGTGFTGVGATGGQFIAQPATGGGFPLLPILLGGLGLAALAALIGGLFLATQLNNSGRGLDTDEWEVDHSVWMDQLQKDFEDSWNTQ
ncbi:uncharacterized protein LOC122372959 [Amphibalanus amphitrite]|uniref:uncharacterized protein LOC122372959 n=1 Tax=Amphibalanus amphitrite TaxID=1232801 RepID=UPI001C902A10|nr:uncharacterized protein LOC122372959 [Amphibalanus amphitrite]